MSRPARDALAGVERLLIDGTNLLHVLSRSAVPAPAATLIGRLRAIIPGTIRIELVFDGRPERDIRNTRIASGLTVRYAGRQSADHLLVGLVTDATGGVPSVEPSLPALLVVTDDGALARELRARGAATIGASWLVRRLDRPDRPGAGSSSAGAAHPRAATVGQPPARSAMHMVRDTAATERDPLVERPGWRPGRGATAKKGNPHRGRPAPRGRT